MADAMIAKAIAAGKIKKDVIKQKDNKRKNDNKDDKNKNDNTKKKDDNDNNKEKPPPSNSKRRRLFPPTNAEPAKLFPIRIDATTSNGHVRIVDTLLFDPSCWPIPLSAPIYDSVEENIRHIANFIISDAEVIGMGRTVRHFTNRVDLWSEELQDLVEDQLRPQLWKCINNASTNCYSSNSNNNNSTVGTNKNTNNNIKKISIRLMVNNVLISDDFDWDISIPMCPIAFANTMTEELNLPIEASSAIAISIVEQLHDSVVINTKPQPPLPVIPGDTTNNNANIPNKDNANNNKNNEPKTSATLIDARDATANLAHIVAAHRPKALETSINNAKETKK